MLRIRRIYIQPPHRKIFWLTIAIAGLLSATIRFPVHLIGNLYQWNPELYIGGSIVLVLFGLWAIFSRHMRWIPLGFMAAILFLLCIQLAEIDKYPIYTCESNDSFVTGCSVAVVAGRCAGEGSADYLTLADIPIGLRVDIQTAIFCDLF